MEVRPHLKVVPMSPMDDEIETAIYEKRRNAISTDARPQTATTAVQSPTAEPSARSSTAEKGFFARVRNISTSSIGTEFGLGSREERPAWIPTWLRLLPLLGIGALVFSISCVVACLGILVGSNEQPTASWKVSPSVFLAIFTAACNRSIEFALVQALPIAWWYYTSRGCTINQLQQNWEAGQGVFRALMNFKAMPLLAFATIMATLVAMDGPLLQKASSVQPRTQTEPTTLQIQLAPELPTGFSGFYDENGIETSTVAAPILKDFLANSTIVGNVSGCKGTCDATVQAPGIMIKNCTTKSWPIDRNTLTNSSATWGSGYAREVAPMPVFASQMYDTSLHPGWNGPEQMELLVGIANYTNCTGNYVEHICTLVPAILEYDIRISDGNIINFAHSSSSGRRVLAAANNTHIDSSQPTIPLTFTLLGAFLEPQIFANASLAPVNPGNPGHAGNVSVPHQDSFNVFSLDHAEDLAGWGGCDSKFRDPTEDILASFNNLMFRSGIVAASAQEVAGLEGKVDQGLNSNQTLTASQTLTQNVYHSDLRWFTGAAVLEMLAILAVAPVFWGWWTLGVRVSFSPLDIAKAFGAPLLENVNSASGPHGIVSRMGEVDVKYGAMDGIDYDIAVIEAGKVPKEFPKRISRLAIGKAHKVRSPKRGMRFDR